MKIFTPNSGAAFVPFLCAMNCLSRSFATRKALTKKKLQIVLLVAEGLMNRHIAGRLYISERIVSTHMQGIFAKLEEPLAQLWSIMLSTRLMKSSRINLPHFFASRSPILNGMRISHTSSPMGAVPNMLFPKG